MNPWDHIGDVVAWLDRSNGSGRLSPERDLRMLKLVEETGEASQAYIGLIGQNPRKGVTHTPEQVADELSDVIITAMVAMHGVVIDPQAHFENLVARRAGRLEDLL